MAGYLVVILVPSWQAVIIGAVFFLSWSAISLPATMDMVSTVLPKQKQTMGVSVNALVRRIPMALGPLLGGAMIGLFGEINGVRLAFGAALLLAGLSLILQQLLIEDERRPASKAKAGLRYNFNLLTPALRNLLVSDILVRFCEQIPYAFVVIWCVSLNGVSPFQFGVLTAIEMAVAILIYIPVAYLADKGEKKPFVTATFGFFTLFPLLLLFSRSFGLMVIAFIVRGLKEFGEPTRKALIMELAHDEQKATTFGFYYLLRDLVVSVAAFGGAFLWAISPEINFLAAFAFGFIGMLYFVWYGRDLR
jgi:MFS family permease